MLDIVTPEQHQAASSIDVGLIDDFQTLVWFGPEETAGEAGGIAPLGKVALEQQAADNDQPGDKDDEEQPRQDVPNHLRA